MSKSVIINIETQTEKKQVISLCHINEKMLAVETSYIANKMLYYNRDLFNKINQTTKISSGVLYRQEIIKPKGNSNRVYSEMENSYEHREVEISRLFFENNKLRRQKRAINKYGRKFDYDPLKVSHNNEGGRFSVEKLSPDDIKASIQVATVEEISLFEDQAIKSILITDSLGDNKHLLEVGYKIQLVVQDSFKEYVNYVIKEAERAIQFLSNYVQSLEYKSNYDSENERFTEDFSNRIMKSLGINVELKSLNLNTDRIKNSEFGQIALACYNLTSLMSSAVSKDLYSTVLIGVLPTRKTNPQNISLFIRNLTRLLENVKFAYLPNNKQVSREKLRSRVPEGRVLVNFVEATTQEKLTIEQESLGYSLFDDDLENLNVYSSADYKKRYALEQAKYYPNISVKDDSKFLTAKERGEFGNTSNAPSFLTPTSLVMGNRKVSTARGMKNINLDDVLQFQLMKSARAQLGKTTTKPQSSQRGSITANTLSSFNVTISSPKETLLVRATDTPIDPLVDSKEYVGDLSNFATNNPLQLLKMFKRKLTKEQRRSLLLAADIVPRVFLRKPTAIRSIKQIQFSNPNSIVRKAISEGNALEMAKIPPHIKFMMSDSFNPNPDSDPMKNRESRPIIEETIKNLYVVKALTGFGVGPLGFPDLHNPIYKNMDDSILSLGRPIIAKAYDYELPELGILKDNYLATIYNNFIYIRGK